MDANGEIHRNLNRTAQKDTLAVPSSGYAVLRFHANNPGTRIHYIYFILFILPFEVIPLMSIHFNDRILVVTLPH